MTFEEAWDALHAELVEWPGFHLADISAGSSFGSRGPNGEMPPDPKHGWWRATYSGSWCATVAKDGWAEREWDQERFFWWAKSPAEAMDAVRVEMNRRRIDPHYAHICDHQFLPECDACVKDWTDGEYDKSEGPLTKEVVYAP